ncbi:hypothetical protein SAMN02745227_01645 [Anaerobranca californiensis DSM 14826]|uniref:Uncharacterized protein n=1 Tax=Anaerobranca californiensis DSM 14826 TaxID=1120989 RepID=A0A1M6Q4V7_9FIRM|nr:hypothetical protein [Anaerobranca californiensis]SHK15153.1 hypothetical protein SAMN02745227_01645 [Anaerobranca californiensis DSM 14826]
MEYRIKKIIYRVKYNDEAKNLGEEALVSIKRASKEIKEQYFSWEPGFSIKRIREVFGEPSYTIGGLYSGPVEVWVFETSTNNIIYIEAWPFVEPPGFYIHCKTYDESIVTFSRWLTLQNSSRHLKVIPGGKITIPT